MNKWTELLFGFLPFFLFFGVAFYACGHSGGFGGNSPGSFKIIKTVDSPDGKYSATFWEGTGGGAAGWCGKSVNVYKKEESFDLGKVEENRENQIIAVDCGCKIEMNWASVNDLHVIYSNQTYVSIKEKTKDVALNISFEVK